MQKLSPLQVCDDDECSGCEAWHKTEQYPIDSPIIEVWGRQWMSQSFAYCAPENADLFAVHLRLPETLQVAIQEFSGDAGVFVEPKSVCGRKPSSVFQVIWTPKADLRQLIMQRQTLPEVCGVARLGTKLGLRCKVEFAAALSAKIRPDQVFLPQGDKSTFLVGPMPYGTPRSSLTKAMSEHGWAVRPLQPVSTRTNVPGLMFRVQAISEPPCKVMRMSHGDVVVTRETEVTQHGPEKPGVVATCLPRRKLMSSKRTTRGPNLRQSKPSHLWFTLAVRLRTWNNESCLQFCRNCRSLQWRLTLKVQTVGLTGSNSRSKNCSHTHKGCTRQYHSMQLTRTAR